MVSFDALLIVLFTYLTPVSPWIAQRGLGSDMRGSTVWSKNGILCSFDCICFLACLLTYDLVHIQRCTQLFQRPTVMWKIMSAGDYPKDVTGMCDTVFAYCKET